MMRFDLTRQAGLHATVVPEQVQGRPGRPRCESETNGAGCRIREIVLFRLTYMIHDNTGVGGLRFSAFWRIQVQRLSERVLTPPVRKCTLMELEYIL